MWRNLARRLLDRVRAFRSSRYWERRYRAGGNSGAGSYGRLAAFKAEILNRFVEERGIRTVIELGCGDGAQLALAHYPSYLGVDVSPAAIALCRDRFGGDPTRRFAVAPPGGKRFDLALSLDVVYHLVEDEVFHAYMERLFDSASAWVVVYASNMTQAEFRGPGARHVRHRRFTDWVARFRPDWALAETVPNRFPYDAADPDHSSFADFYIFRNNAG